jgi:histone deacetylase 11
MKKQQSKKRRRRIILVAGGVIALTIFGCVYPPKSFRAVKQPRAGRAMNDKVAIVYSKHYQINVGGLEKLHSFDINKYAKIYLALNTNGLLRPEDVFVPKAVTNEQILLVHTPEFLASLKNSKTVARYLEAPIIAAAPAGLVDAAVLNAFRYATGGTILAGRLALKHGIAINLAGGYHHAKPNAGEGFNVYADMAIAIRALQKDGHPIPKEKSDFDVELPAGTGDEKYLRLLARCLPKVIAVARPDIVFIQAGCDTLAGDPLARLKMSAYGIVRRDAMVIDRCVGEGIPVVMCLGGGYSKGAWLVQYDSICRTIKKYGPTDSNRPRRPTVKEKLYTK